MKGVSAATKQEKRAILVDACLLSLRAVVINNQSVQLLLPHER